MLTEYRIPVISPAIRRFNWQMRMVHFFVGYLLLIFAYHLYRTGGGKWVSYLSGITGTGEIFFSLLFKILTRNRPGLNQAVRIFSVALLLLTALSYLLHGKYLTAFIIAAISAGIIGIINTERRMKTPPFVKVNEQGILYPGLFGDKHFPWNRLNHVILRNQVLTLDFNDNRVLQIETEAIAEDEQWVTTFNGFCQHCIHP